MQFIIKLMLANCIILAVVLIGKKMPSLSGLLVTMPITSLAAMLMLYWNSQDKQKVMTEFTKGAIWGIAPTILFFISAYFCFAKGYPIWLVLVISFACWLIGAAIHQLLL
jgi:uncharacterized membrane protein (GlpM family)